MLKARAKAIKAKAASALAWLGSEIRDKLSLPDTERERPVEDALLEEKDRVVALGVDILKEDAEKALAEKKSYSEWLRNFSPWDVGPPGKDGSPTGRLGPRANSFDSALALAWVGVGGTFSKDEEVQMLAADAERKRAKVRLAASRRMWKQLDATLADRSFVQALQTELPLFLKRVAAAGGDVGPAAEGLVRANHVVGTSPLAPFLAPLIGSLADQFAAWASVMHEVHGGETKCGVSPRSALRLGVGGGDGLPSGSGAAAQVLDRKSAAGSAQPISVQPSAGARGIAPAYETKSSTARHIRCEDDETETKRIQKELSEWMQKELENKMVEFKRENGDNVPFAQFALQEFPENCKRQPDGSIKLSERLSEVEALFTVIRGDQRMHKLGELPRLGAPAEAEGGFTLI